MRETDIQPDTGRAYRASKIRFSNFPRHTRVRYVHTHVYATVTKATNIYIGSFGENRRHT